MCCVGWENDSWHAQDCDWPIPHLTGMVMEVKHWMAFITYPSGKAQLRTIIPILQSFSQGSVHTSFSSPQLSVFLFLFQLKDLMWYSGLALAFESRDWKPWCLSFAAPLDTRSSPFVPLISPSSSQEELQTILGKFCSDISVQWGPTYQGLLLKKPYTLCSCCFQATEGFFLPLHKMPTSLDPFTLIVYSS